MSVTPARAARRLRLAHLRPLSTSADTPRPQREDRPKTWKPQENSRWMHPRMIFVRPWDGVQTMAHAFAIIREIERRFGKVQEFVVLRDSDVWTNNLPYMHATFARAEYADAIPLEGRVIQVTVPEVDLQRTGGVGLDDLEVYLDPQARAQALSTDTESATTGTDEGKVREDGLPVIMMDVKIERSGMRDPPPALDFIIGGKGRSQGPPPILRNPQRAQELADAIISFGGFAATPKEPADPAKPKTRIQLVMERWGWKEEAVRTVADEQPAPLRENPTEPEPVPWTPFPKQDEMTLEASPPPLEPTTSDLPSSPPPPPPQSPPPSDATAPPTLQQPPPTPKPTQSPVHKLSKKQRMLLAARTAGAQAASQPPENDHGSLKDPAEEMPDMDIDDTAPSKPDPKDAAKRYEENKRAAGQWWDFFNRRT